MKTKTIRIENPSPQLLEFVEILKSHHVKAAERLDLKIENLKTFASQIIDLCKDLNEWEFECVMNLVKNGSESIDK